MSQFTFLVKFLLLVPVEPILPVNYRSSTPPLIEHLGIHLMRRILILFKNHNERW